MQNITYLFLVATPLFILIFLVILVACPEAAWRLPALCRFSFFSFARFQIFTRCFVSRNVRDDSKKEKHKFENAETRARGSTNPAKTITLGRVSIYEGRSRSGSRGIRIRSRAIPILPREGFYISSLVDTGFHASLRLGNFAQWDRW